MYKDI